MERKRIPTGDRPTGKLHIGHYVGSLRNRVRLQDEYECFFIIADLHTLTTKPEKEHIEELADNVRSAALDYLACGIDPAKSVIYLQSAVPEVCELAVLFDNLITVPRLSRVPSLKEMAQGAGIEEMPFGLLGYPVLQAADILMPRATSSPSARTTSPTSRSRARSRAASTSSTARPSPCPTSWSASRAPSSAPTAPPKCPSPSATPSICRTTRRPSPRKSWACTPTPSASRRISPARWKATPSSTTTTPSTRTGREVEDLKARYGAGKVGDVEVKEKLIVSLNAFLDPSASGAPGTNPSWASPTRLSTTAR